MDIVSYSVDVRITNLVVAAGVMLHAVWPRAGALAGVAHEPFVAASAAGLIVGVLWLWISVRRAPETELPVADPPQATAGAAGGTLIRATGVVGLLVLVAAAAIVIIAGPLGKPLALWITYGVVALAFLVVVVAGGQQREADTEIKNAIEEERPQARRMALRELAWLMPVVMVMAVVWAAVAYVPAIAQVWRATADWRIGGQVAPVAGAAVAMHGAVVGAIAGWALRILFTLAYGREAFGAGDIYILAAAGAAGGWDIALLGLLFSVGIALVGWIVGLLLKSTVMIPFAPWLALGFVLGLVWQRPAHQIAADNLGAFRGLWTERPDLLLVAGGIVLVGTAVAVILGRLVRRAVER
jgi:Ca2+/Na+ antiporter